MMQIEKEISRYYEVVPYPKFKDCWRSDLGDPNAGGVTTIFKILPAGDACIALIVVDGFDEKLCNAIINLVNENCIDKSCTNTALSIIGGLSVEGYPFDSVAITNYESFRMFEAVDKDLDKKTCGVAPISRCELTANETAKEVLGVFAKLVESTCWKRTIAPRISMRYRLTTGVTKKYRLYDQYALSCALEELNDENKYNIEINNFKEEYIKISIEDNCYCILGKDETIYLQAKSLSEVEQWVQMYLTKGLV